MFYVLGHDWDLEVVLFSSDSQDECRQFMDGYDGELPSLELVDSTEFLV